MTKSTDVSTKLDSYYIAGDILRINEEQFPSLARDANTPNTGIQSLTFDARIIFLDMPLVFDSAKLLLMAEKVIFTNRAAILFNALAPQLNGDGISIIADDVDLTSAKTRPFQFKTDNWEFLSDGSQRPWPSDHQRKIDVSSNHISASDPLLKEDMFKFFRNLTLDQKYGYAPGGLSLAPYILHVGDDVATQRYDNSFSTVVVWPDELSRRVDPTGAGYFWPESILCTSHKLGCGSSGF